MIPTKTLRNSFTGCISEYVAASYFLNNNMQVYWPAVQQGSDDFVVSTPGGFRRVQVKTASWVNKRKHRWLRCRTSTGAQSLPAFEAYDLLVVVNGENLWVIPASLITAQTITLFKTNTKAVLNKWEPYRHAIFAATGDTTGEVDV